ncbi:MAG TPA: TIGR03032 family protein [Rhizomicrobium sp.]|nr:TIGR03032 family protein [Rhizomicrobium sp.]
MTPEPEETFGPLEIETSPNFAGWLGSLNTSLIFSAYHSSKIVFVGRPLDQETISISEGNNLTRCMGIGVHPDARSFGLATKNQIIRFLDLVPADATYEGHDSIYQPHRIYVTGYLDTHDVVTAPNGSLLFVNTNFSCIGALSEGYSFRPVWNPPFITDLVPEDRCHLNGMATINGIPRFVTAVAESDTPKGWRDKMEDGGILMDVGTGEILMRGLSMPHSPRVHNGRLWMLESGKGAFGYVDLQERKFVPIAFCPGFARGMALHGDYAVICLSLPRSDDKDFSHMILGKQLDKSGAPPRCGLMVVDTRNGETVATLTATSGARELFDVDFLPGVRNPKVIDFQNEEINRVILMDTRR